MQQALSKITGQLTQLQHIQAILAQRLAAQTAAAPPQPYQPVVTALPAATYWCSRKAVDCTEAEIATLFAEFYRELGAAALLDTETSGFITDLPVTNPGGYMAASFRILKATTHHADEPYIPQLERPAGRYVRVWVENTQAGIDRGLRALQAYCQAQALQPQPVLWQLNAGDAWSRMAPRNSAGWRTRWRKASLGLSMRRNSQMQAIQISEPVPASALKSVTLPTPQPVAGHDVVQVKAFGVNESEVTSRKGESDGDFHYPRVLGIEGVGVISATAPDSPYQVGQQVAMMMGGLGRAIDGTYAEYCLVPHTAMIPLKTNLDWSLVGALPEMLQTAYGSLHVA